MSDNNDGLAVKGEVLRQELAIPEEGKITRANYIELASNLLGLARDNVRNDLIRIAVQEFEYIVRRRREIAVATVENEGIIEYLNRKQAALEAGEFTIDTISGQLHFLNPDLQPWR